MKSLKSSLVIMLFGVCCFWNPSFARADSGIGAAAVLAATFQSLNSTPGLSADRQFGFPGGGALVDFGLGDFRLQSGLLILQHQAIGAVGLQLPLLLRYKILPMLSLGGGGYAGYATTSAEFGFLASAAAEIPVGFFDVLIDGRFAKSVKSNEFQVLAGVRLGIGI